MNLVYNVPCTGVVRAKTHCDILQLSKSDTSHVLHHFPDSNATPFSSYSCMLLLFPSLHFRYISYLFCLLMSIFISPLPSCILALSSSLSSLSSNFPVHYISHFIFLPHTLCPSQLQTRWRRASNIAVMLPLTRLYLEAVTLANNLAVWLDWKRNLDPTPAW